MASTPTSEIVRTIQAVKRLQADLKNLARAVEIIGDRLARLETRLDALKKD